MSTAAELGPGPGVSLSQVTPEILEAMLASRDPLDVEAARLLLGDVEIGDRSVWASIHLPAAVLGLVSGPSCRSAARNTVRVRQRIAPVADRRAAGPPPIARAS